MLLGKTSTMGYCVDLRASSCLVGGILAKSKRVKARDAADKAFSLYIRARDKRCVLCGRQDQLTCGHVFSRVAYSTRWHPLVSFAQCWGCNLRHEHDPYPFMNYARKMLGDSLLDKMHNIHMHPIKLKEYDLREIAEFYKLALKEGLTYFSTDVYPMPGCLIKAIHLGE
jgi:hypothetical protein